MRATPREPIICLGTMRRLSIITLAFAVGLATAVGASARAEQEIGSQAGQLELQRGAGTVVVAMVRGAILGRFERGRLTVTNRKGGATEITVFGAEETIERENGTIYRGQDIRFKISGLGWRVGIQAVGLDLSLVGRGVATLRGTGLVSVDGEPFRPWPPDFRSIVLGG